MIIDSTTKDIASIGFVIADSGNTLSVMQSFYSPYWFKSLSLKLHLYRTAGTTGSFRVAIRENLGTIDSPILGSTDIAFVSVNVNTISNAGSEYTFTFTPSDSIAPGNYILYAYVASGTTFWIDARTGNARPGLADIYNNGTPSYIFGSSLYFELKGVPVLDAQPLNSYTYEDSPTPRFENINGTPPISNNFYGGWGAQALGAAYYGAMQKAVTLLTVDNITSSTTIDGNILLQTESTLEIEDISVGTYIDNVDLTNITIIDVDDIVTSTHEDNVSLKNIFILDIDNVSVSTDVSDVILTTRVLIHADNMSVSTDMNNLEVSTLFLLHVDDITVDIDMESATRPDAIYVTDYRDNGDVESTELEDAGLYIRDFINSVVLSNLWVILLGTEDGFIFQSEEEDALLIPEESDFTNTQKLTDNNLYTGATIEKGQF